MQCDCAADNLFKCKKSGVHVCHNVEFKCDGLWHCDDWADELMLLTLLSSPVEPKVIWCV